MEQPLVSVVIPCYNHEKFVQDCIQSVIDQTYENIETVQEYLNLNAEKIQCVVSHDKLIPAAVPFGKTQQPGLSDYADEVDTMAFLAGF